ncbi:hypothetical protein [Streptomyces fractus]|uniref:hypothetical protein n=1 Tax=Streptomyces fractus TaxID=641806 RepID=UPI003CEEA4FF
MASTYDVPIRASELRRGDVFELHRKTRTAADGPWPAGYGHVSVPLVGGGFAILSKLTPLTVTRERP